MLKGQDRLLTRAAQKHTCVFATSYRAATVRERCRDDFFSILLRLLDIRAV
jgi:hypothetical protein